MNFADQHVFGNYGHFMFAQDEIQVAEHPALAAIRELMVGRTDRLRPLTWESDAPTPVLVRGAERTLNIDTRSIYGARFARAADATIRECSRVLDPPTRTNILAISAPVSSGGGSYARAEIMAALRTAYSGFRAVVLASVSDHQPIKPIVLHTGNWGCGAFGGDRQLMLSIQMMAAHLAGITEAVFYCGSDSVDAVWQFESELQGRFKFKPGVRVETIVDRLVGASFQWGRPDGN